VSLTAAEAKTHLDANAIVTGKVAEVNFSPSVVHINFEKPYPNQTFTAVIFVARTNQFQGLDKLKGQTVAVTGQIKDYHGRPEIVLANSNQLKLVDQPVQPAAAQKK
jgi:DNA/RNA endonuclease YhcR with UshA esterase domain